MNKKNKAVYYLILSLLSIFLLSLLILYDSNRNNITDNSDRYLISLLLIICFIIGLLRTLHPKSYKKVLKYFNKESIKTKTQNSNRRKIGHHPDCEKFQKHRIFVKNKVYCTGCLGLAIGCVISILLIISYLILYVNLNYPIHYYLFFLGVVIVILTFLEILLPFKQKHFHMFINAFFVISFLLITLSILEITNNIIYAMISILISFLWLETRITLSSYNHSAICSRCSETCKMFN